MKPNHLVRIFSLLVLASAALTAQVARQENVVPLKNWATPLYWQANRTETPQTGGAQLVFSANAVSTDALTFVAITPCRLVDTRGTAAGFNGIAPFSGPSIPAAGALTISVRDTAEATANTEPAPCGVIPSIAQAYSFNLTVVPHAGGAVDYVSLWPAGSPQPFVATLDDPQGMIVSNAAIVPGGTPAGGVWGGVSIYNAGPATTDVVIDMNGYFTAPTDLNGNTGVGFGTLASNTTGVDDTASGNGALYSDTTGSDNTANGYGALGLNTTGAQNTATGSGALFNNTTGDGNMASGYWALYSNTTGYHNTASGYSALVHNTTGQYNVASGAQALNTNTTGSVNTAGGSSALFNNTTGSWNTASGANALLNNTTGNYNTAEGLDALGSSTTGSDNTASGYAALFSNTTGSNNIAIGNQAARNVSGENSNNIHIGAEGAFNDGSVIKIGTVGTQTSTFIAGIYEGTPSTPNLLVCVDANGTLGTTGCSGTPSSRRFKEQITDMGDSSSKLLQLRPVTFFYKPQYDDGSHTLQYGLIAEEVAKLYPEMVGYDKDGQPSSVRYQSLAPMLLNEVQKQDRQLQDQNAQLQKQVQLQQEENRKLEDRLAVLEALLSSQAPAATQPASIQ